MKKGKEGKEVENGKQQQISNETRESVVLERAENKIEGRRLKV